MKRIPVSKLIRGQAEAIVYYDDYWEDIESGDLKYDVHDPLPGYAIEGDEKLVEEFEEFVSENETLHRDYNPMPWSAAGRLAYSFAQEKGIEREYILPEEYKEMSKLKNKNPNIRY